jgi:hypothetical protein
LSYDSVSCGEPKDDYATARISHVFGISEDEIKGPSFYYAVTESYLEEVAIYLQTVKSTNRIG